MQPEVSDARSSPEQPPANEVQGYRDQHVALARTEYALGRTRDGLVLRWISPNAELSGAQRVWRSSDSARAEDEGCPSPERAAGILPPPNRRREMVSQGKKLLVVDDSEELLNILSRSLAAAGYDVVWARSGEDALKLLTRDERPIALTIVDVVLPGMSGPELVEKVREHHPRAGVMYVSAFDEETVLAHGVDPSSVRFLPKPYEPEDLLREVEEALGER